MSKSHSTAFGPIEPSTVYPLVDFKRRTGWGDTAMREARRGGLTVVRAHGRVFVRGSDFIDYLDRLAKDGDTE